MYTIVIWGSMLVVISYISLLRLLMVQDAAVFVIRNGKRLTLHASLLCDRAFAFRLALLQSLHARTAAL